MTGKDRFIQALKKFVTQPAAEPQKKADAPQNPNEAWRKYQLDRADANRKWIIGIAVALILTLISALTGQDVVAIFKSAF